MRSALLVWMVPLALTGSHALVSINTSLATLPVVYFGGNNQSRSDENIGMLAKMRAVLIEKWEGPCWSACIQNNSLGIPCDPACGGESYMLNTLKRVKLMNPAVSTGYYQNSLYDWNFQNLESKFASKDLNQRSTNGSIVGMENDNGMIGVPVFALGQPAAVDMWLDWHRQLIASGVVDGTFLDKPTIYAFPNGTVYNLCECATGPCTHEWIQACAKISVEAGRAYNAGKRRLLEEIQKVYRPLGGFITAHDNGSARYIGGGAHISAAALITRMQQMKEDPSQDYTWVSSEDQKTGWDPADLGGTCSEDMVAKFLVAVEQGGLIGCNGWQGEYGNPLGDPKGPATKQGKAYTRTFSSGTVAMYDDSTKRGSVKWASSA